MRISMKHITLAASMVCGGSTLAAQFSDAYFLATA